MSDIVTTDHQPMEAVHIDDRPWETLRWPGQWSKMLFHPRSERATEPNAGLVRYEPGSHHPLHKHDFAQVWYILEGQFQIGERTYGPARCSSTPTRTGKRRCRRRPAGSCSFVQYQGPTTGGRPI
jgi:hypothetical protein